MIDAELYRVFYIVAGCPTISAAAEQLHVSQPAVSKSIKKLEDLTGCLLFQRSSKGIRLTSEGAILLEYVRSGFQHLENGERIVKKIRNRERGVVRVGISTTLCKYFFIPYLERFHQRYPGIRITIVNRTSPETLNLLEQGVIDFGIISIPESRSRFTFHELLTISDIFVGSHRFAELPTPQPLAALASYPLMMLEKDNLTRTHVDAHLHRYGVALQPEIEIGSLEFLIEFARIGLGIALVIKNFVEEELGGGSLVEIAVTPAIPPRKIGIVVPDNLPLSIAAETFIDFIIREVTEQKVMQ